MIACLAQFVTRRICERGRMKQAFARMKSRWGVGPFGVLAILAAFALAGSSVVRFGYPVMRWILPPDSPTWQRVVVWLLVIFPMYHVLLLAWAALLGQFRFFWEREKRLVRRLRSLGQRRPSN